MLTCQHCGAVLRADAFYCEKCGFAARPEYENRRRQSTVPRTSERPSGHTKWGVALTGLCITLLSAAVVYLGLNLLLPRNNNLLSFLFPGGSSAPVVTQNVAVHTNLPGNTAETLVPGQTPAAVTPSVNTQFDVAGVWVYDYAIYLSMNVKLDTVLMFMNAEQKSQFEMMKTIKFTFNADKTGMVEADGQTGKFLWEQDGDMYRFSPAPGEDAQVGSEYGDIDGLSQEGDKLWLEAEGCRVYLKKL